MSNPDLDRVGAGNFLAHALRISRAPEADLLWLERPLRAALAGLGSDCVRLSLSTLARARDAYAAWYFAAGVRPKDPVAVYLDDGVEYLVHYLALTALGAIPVLTNGALGVEIAAGYFRKVGAVGLFTDRAHRAALEPYLRPDDGYRFVVTEETLDGSLAALPPEYPFAHAPADPIMIAHSSGTTGIPKAVVLQHQGFFVGVRYRLEVSSTGGAERILSALPHSHNCAMAYLMLALICGNPVYVSSEHDGHNLGARIGDFRPTMVVAFPESYVELTEEDLSALDARSVRFWFNGGDAAHEQHIRTLLRLSPGSIFVDGMGSSEMGFSLLRNVHMASTDHYDRCVGTPLEWVEAAVLGDAGETLPPGVIGSLGVKAPSVTSGYWNDSALTHRTQRAGYWLTGDLAYRDAEGRFYHVDRVPDVVRTARGTVYTLATEELLLKHLPGLADCSVIAVPDAAGRFEAPLLLARVRPQLAIDEPTLLAAVNRVLDDKGWGRMAAVKIVSAAEIPLGTTGKVLKRLLRERHRGHFAAAAGSLTVAAAG